MSEERRRRPTASSFFVRAALPVAAAGVSALAGTMLHLQALQLGQARFPLGAVAALMLAASAQLWVGLFSRSAVVAVITGILTYVLVGLMSVPHGSYPLVSAGLAGSIWIYGLAAVTPLAALLCRRILRPGRGGRRT